MANRVDVLRSMLGQLYPMRHQATKGSEDVDLHLLSVIMLLCTRGDVLDAVYPLDKTTDPGALYDLGVDPQRATRDMIESLRPYREVFAGVQIAWLDLSGYQDPPCPPDTPARALVNCTRNLPKK